MYMYLCWVSNKIHRRSDPTIRGGWSQSICFAKVIRYQHNFKKFKKIFSCCSRSVGEILYVKSIKIIKCVLVSLMRYKTYIHYITIPVFDIELNSNLQLIVGISVQIWTVLLVYTLYHILQLGSIKRIFHIMNWFYCVDLYMFSIREIIKPLLFINRVFIHNNCIYR